MNKLLLILTGFFACGSTFAQHKDAVYMTEARFMTGDSSGWSAAAYEDASWRSIHAGVVWQEQGFPDYHGYAWYRIHVIIPAALRERGGWKDSLRILLAHVNDVDETYLNGVKIGQTGAFPSDAGGYVSKWPAVREYHVAAHSPAIHWDVDNVIAVRVYDGGGTGGIFMGVPYVDMLERTDGLRIGVVQDSIRYAGAEALVPLELENLFNISYTGTLRIRVRDEALGKDMINETREVRMMALGRQRFSWKVPNRSGIEISYSFLEREDDLEGEDDSKRENNSKRESNWVRESNLKGEDRRGQRIPAGLKVSGQVTLPYILTPAPSSLPKINSAAVVGTHPGSPFLFTIAATGRRPLQYRVSGLPAGLKLDEGTGIISGVLADSGRYRVEVTVRNGLGEARQQLVIRVGRELALTPPMGWNSWNCWGLSVSAEKVKRSAQALIDKGLINYGWTYINIDDGWELPHRAADSSVVPNEKFPDMKALGDWLHGHGLKFGIYSSPGPKTCGGFLGSYQHEVQDAAAYAGWGVDYLKYDWCSYDGIVAGDTSLAAYIRPYALMRDALAAQRRDIVYSLCQYGMKDVWKWGREVSGQSWRTTEDIEDTWKSFSGIGFSQAGLWPYAGPGHWNDPDMMIVGQVGWGESLHSSRLTPDEQYTHVSLWCLLSAPLLIGCDLSRLDAFTLNLLTNAEVLALDQDMLGRQARRVLERDSCQVWVKDMADGSRAVGIFNMGSGYRQVAVEWSALGLKAAERVRDLWRQKELGVMTGGGRFLLAPHGVELIKVRD